MADRMFGELANEDDAVRAIERLHDAGYRRVEAYMPYPSEAVQEVLGHRTRLPYVIAVAGVGAAVGAYALQWLLVAYLYPLVVGGRPPHFPLAFVIISFEMGVLFASLTAFGGTLACGKLVRLLDDVQGIPGFTSVTENHFWLEISTRDPAYDEDAARRLLGECGAVHVAVVEDER